MKKLSDLLQDSYVGPEGSTSSGLFTSFAVPRGSASDRQLGLIEKLSHGSGDNLAKYVLKKSHGASSAGGIANNRHSIKVRDE